MENIKKNSALLFIETKNKSNKRRAGNGKIFRRNKAIEILLVCALIILQAAAAPGKAWQVDPPAKLDVEAEVGSIHFGGE
jgi:hypothetical protein